MPEEEEEPFTVDFFIPAYVSIIIGCIPYVVPFLEFVQGRSIFLVSCPNSLVDNFQAVMLEGGYD
jgi:hypothetical protein